MSTTKTPKPKFSEQAEYDIVPLPYKKGGRYMFGKVRYVYECIVCDDELAVFARVYANESRDFDKLQARTQDMSIEKGTYTEI